MKEDVVKSVNPRFRVKVIAVSMSVVHGHHLKSETELDHPRYGDNASLCWANPLLLPLLRCSWGNQGSPSDDGCYLTVTKVAELVGP